MEYRAFRAAWPSSLRRNLEQGVDDLLPRFRREILDEGDAVVGDFGRGSQDGDHSVTSGKSSATELRASAIAGANIAVAVVDGVITLL